MADKQPFLTPSTMYAIDSPPLLDTDQTDTSPDPTSEKAYRLLHRSPYSRSHRRSKTAILGISIVLNIAFAGALVYLFYYERAHNPNIFWTPFTSQLKYHVRVFDTGFREGSTPYQAPPGPETDKLWEDLYVEAFTVPKSVAAKQVNKTVPVSADPGAEYITSFSVMHYLHCLNMIRQMTELLYYPEYYNATPEHNPITDGLDSWDQFLSGGMFERDHISHCIDSLRQAMMCMPDLGPVVWQWVPDQQSVKVFADTAHTCANYDEVLEYAKEKAWPGDFVMDKDLGAVGQCGYYDENCGYRA